MHCSFWWSHYDIRHMENWWKIWNVCLFHDNSATAMNKKIVFVCLHRFLISWTTYVRMCTWLKVVTGKRTPSWAWHLSVKDLWMQASSCLVCPSSSLEKIKRRDNFNSAVTSKLARQQIGLTSTVIRNVCSESSPWSWVLLKRNFL